MNTFEQLYKEQHLMKKLVITKAGYRTVLFTPYRLPKKSNITLITILTFAYCIFPIAITKSLYKISFTDKKQSLLHQVR